MGVAFSFSFLQKFDCLSIVRHVTFSEHSEPSDSTRVCNLLSSAPHNLSLLLAMDIPGRRVSDSSSSQLEQQDVESSLKVYRQVNPPFAAEFPRPSKHVEF